MPYKTYLERHPEHIMLYWKLKELELYQGDVFPNWNGDFLEMRQMDSKKMVGRYCIHPLAGIVREKPWQSDL